MSATATEVKPPAIPPRAPLDTAGVPVPAYCFSSIYLGICSNCALSTSSSCLCLWYCICWNIATISTCGVVTRCRGGSIWHKSGNSITCSCLTAPSCHSSWTRFWCSSCPCCVSPAWSSIPFCCNWRRFASSMFETWTKVPSSILI